MKKQVLPLFACLSVTAAFIACNDQPAASNTEGKTTDSVKVRVKGEEVTYNSDTVTLKGYVAYNEMDSTKRPAVLIVPEWWGISDYTRGRARQLAELGYVGMAVDMYGNGIEAGNPELAGKMATPFYKNPQMAKARIDAALAKLKSYPQVDTGKIAAIGYCFGGAVVLNVARLGEDLKGVVSFHGNLVGVPAKKELLKAKVLVCHGADDKFVPQTEVDAFKKQMDSIGADYTFKAYPGATHAFTNPAATENGKKFNLPIAYNAAADSASWKDMRDFFDKIFK